MLKKPTTNSIINKNLFFKLQKDSNDIKALRLTGTITFNIDEFVHAIDKKTNKIITDRKELNDLDVRYIALNAIIQNRGWSILNENNLYSLKLNTTLTKMK